MAKVGEYFITRIPDSQLTLTAKQYGVALGVYEQMGLNTTRLIASAPSHWAATKILEALNDAAKRDQQEMQDTYKGKLAAHAWQFATRAALAEMAEIEKADKRGVTITITNERGFNICTKGVMNR